jgi:DNA-binding Lrp family transcriptional regulator
LKVVIFVKERDLPGSAAEALSKIEGVIEVMEVTGRDDIVAIADVLSDDELKWLRDRLKNESSLESFEIAVVAAERKR